MTAALTRVQAKPQNSKQEVKNVERGESVSILHTLLIHPMPVPGSWGRLEHNLRR